MEASVQDWMTFSGLVLLASLLLFVNYWSEEKMHEEYSAFYKHNKEQGLRFRNSRRETLLKIRNNKIMENMRGRGRLDTRFVEFGENRIV